MNTFETLSEALRDLRTRGFSHEFELDHHNLACPELNLFLYPSQIQVSEIYHLEESHDNSMQLIVYAIDTLKDIKGFLVVNSQKLLSRISDELKSSLKIEVRTEKDDYNHPEDLSLYI